MGDRVIWKFQLAGDYTSIWMPENGRVIHFADQNGVYHIWAEVDPEEFCTNRTFRIVGTGQSIPEGNNEYLGTILDGVFVWHLYEDKA